MRGKPRRRKLLHTGTAAASMHSVSVRSRPRIRVNR